MFTKKARDGINKRKHGLGGETKQFLHLMRLFSFFLLFAVAALGLYPVRPEPPLPNPLLACAFFDSYFLCLADFLQRR